MLFASIVALCLPLLSLSSDSITLIERAPLKSLSVSNFNQLVEAVRILGSRYLDLVEYKKVPGTFSRYFNIWNGVISVTLLFNGRESPNEMQVNSVIRTITSMNDSFEKPTKDPPTNAPGVERLGEFQSKFAEFEHLLNNPVSEAEASLNPGSFQTKIEQFAEFCLFFEMVLEGMGALI